MGTSNKARFSLQCGGCLFFQSIELDGYDGLCRRHAPRPMVIGLRDDGRPDVYKVVADWPQVTAEDWCGDHQPSHPLEDEGSS